MLGDEKYRAAAEKNLAFVQSKLWEPPPSVAQKSSPSPPAEERAGLSSGLSSIVPLTKEEVPLTKEEERRPLLHTLTSVPGNSQQRCGALYHRWRDGQRDNVQLLEGYAFLLSGVLELYEAALEPRHLDFAIALADAMLARFYDAENGGFWQSPPGASELILRVKEDYDGAEPSGNSVAIMTLLKLGKITDRKEFTQAAEKSLRLFSSRLQQVPQAVPCMLQALDFWLDEPHRAVVAGSTADAKTRELLRAIHSLYQPNKVVLGNTGAVEPFAKTLPAKDGPVVYVCTGTSCLPPTNHPEKLRELLK